MVRAAVVGLALALASCGRAPEIDYDQKLLEVRLSIHEDRLNRLEARQPADYAAFRPKDKSWQWVTNQDFPLRVGIDKIAASGNGSKVTVSVGNPLSMALRDCTMSVLWAETDSQGVAIEATKHKESMKLEADLPAGGFAFPSFDLADIPPAKLGLVTVSEIYCLRTG